MFCKCFCPGTLRDLEKDIEINYNDKVFKLSGVKIRKCSNPVCRGGYIAKETWKEIEDVVGEVPEGGESYRLGRKIIAALIEK